ncbi:putative mitochondrial protein [Cucumis melo var. makuwa]|uniref:Mitochondrial protein n=1 Tax=Cucumis melo var. makuwa TaxID=1194695 RepID=A0A5D3B8X5_CUCMM|nr:putative mitochondrial protein [Cucumis melo var. makuwa]TYJ96310.1 putative mitochondrial protein [Cucumis melo var. makuwa]
MAFLNPKSGHHLFKRIGARPNPHGSKTPWQLLSGKRLWMKNIVLYSKQIHGAWYHHLPLDQNVVGSKWVFRLKRHTDGSILRYKARMVAKGFHQHPGVDFFETFSPVIKASTIRVVLSIAVTNGWPLRQLDFNNAFLNGHLEENVYMMQPPGYVHPSYPKYVCKLNKAIYGLKQAPCAWNATLSKELLKWSFINSRSDSSLFIFRRNNSVVLLLVYVDDIIVTSNDSVLISTLIKSLDKQFALKDLGRLTYFLGFQVNYLKSGFILNQEKYISDLLHKLQLSDLKPAPSPSVVGKNLSAFGGTPLEDPFVYRSTIGALQNLTNTRPDIAYIVNQLSDDLVISAYFDVDWASNIDDRKSIAAYCVFIGNNLVSCCPSRKPVIWCDNISAGGLAMNPVFHARTKNIEIDVHFVRDQVLKGALEVRYVPSVDQLADCLTKSLIDSQFQHLRIKLGVINLPSRLRGC